MKNVRTTHFSFVFSKFFNLWREQFLCGVGDAGPVQRNVTVEKTPKRAGATPLSCGQAAQKFRRSLPPSTLYASAFFPRWRVRGSKVSCALY